VSAALFRPESEAGATGSEDRQSIGPSMGRNPPPFEVQQVDLLYSLFQPRGVPTLYPNDERRAPPRTLPGARPRGLPRQDKTRSPVALPQPAQHDLTEPHVRHTDAPHPLRTVLCPGRGRFTRSRWYTTEDLLHAFNSLDRVGRCRRLP